MKLSLTLLLATALSLSSASPTPAAEPEQHESGLEERQIVHPNWAGVRDNAYWARDLAAMIVNQPFANADNLLAVGTTQAAINARNQLNNIRVNTFFLANQIIAFADMANSNTL